jgi:hypothetical protein
MITIVNINKTLALSDNQKYRSHIIKPLFLNDNSLIFYRSIFSDRYFVMLMKTPPLFIFYQSIIHCSVNP